MGRGSRPKNCCQSPLPNCFYLIVNSENVTTAQGVRCCTLSTARTSARPQNSGQTTRASQFATTYPNRLYQRGALPRRPLIRRSRNGIQRQSTQEIVRARQLHSNIPRGLLLDLQAPKAAPQMFTRLQRNVRFSATETLIKVRGRGARCAATTPENEKQAGAKRRYLEVQTHTDRQILGFQRIPLQGLLRNRRRIARSIRRRLQVPRMMGALRAPPHRSRETDLAAKAISSQGGALDAQTPNISFVRSAQRCDLKAR